MTCNGCGKTDHAGGCDLVDFYYYQRWARVNPSASGNIVQESLPTAPPSPLIDSNMAGVIEATPLAVQTSKLTLQVTELASTRMVGLVESPLMPQADILVRQANNDDELNPSGLPIERNFDVKIGGMITIKKPVPYVFKKKDTLGIKSKKTKAIDDPVVIKRREEIRAARVLNMARARAHRKTVAA